MLSTSAKLANLSLLANLHTDIKIQIIKNIKLFTFKTNTSFSIEHRL